MPDRIIKESCCGSDTLNELSDWAERFWWHLTVVCDDFGRFDARPEILKARLFPLRDGKTKRDMANALKELASVGLISLYEVDGRPFLQVVKWQKHQRCRAAKSKFPPPPADIRGRLPTNASENENENVNENVFENESESDAPAGASGGRSFCQDETKEEFLARLEREYGKSGRGG